MMAVFSLGADEIRTRQMEKIAEAWGFAGKYPDVTSLIRDAKKKKFDSILVIDLEAIDERVRMELKNIGIEIITFKDKKVLEKKIL